MKSAKQIEAERRLRDAIRAVEAVMPEGMGIALFVFEHNTDKGHTGYISNGRRDDIRRWLTEFMNKWESDARGAPFYPLTLDAFEGWVTEHAKAPRAKGWLGPVQDALTMYRYLSNGSSPNETEVSQQ